MKYFLWRCTACNKTSAFYESEAKAAWEAKRHTQTATCKSKKGDKIHILATKGKS